MEKSILLKLEQIEKKLNSIECHNSKMQNNIDEINTKLKSVETNCSKMSNHIDFVEIIYEKIKSPFHYVLDKIDLKYLKN